MRVKLCKTWGFWLTFWLSVLGGPGWHGARSVGYFRWCLGSEPRSAGVKGHTPVLIWKKQLEMLYPADERMSNHSLPDAISDLAFVSGELQRVAKEAGESAKLELLRGDRRKLFEMDAHRRIRKLIEILDRLPVEVSDV